jgi:hypothetical protein
LAELPPHLAQILVKAECIYSPEADRLLRRIVPIRADGIGTTPAGRLRSFRMTETGWPDEVLREIAASPRCNEFDPAILILPETHSVRFDEAVELVPDLPLFRVRYRDARQALKELWRPLSGLGGALLETLEAGVAVDSYSGYPPSNPGPAECTYEVASWGAA